MALVLSIIAIILGLFNLFLIWRHCKKPDYSDVYPELMLDDEHDASPQPSPPVKDSIEPETPWERRNE